MLEYFIFILMIIGGAAIIVFSIDKKRRSKNNNNYVGLSSKGVMTKSRATYRRPTFNPPAPKDKVDTLFSGNQTNNKDRYNKIMERKKNIRPGEVEIPINAWNKADKKTKGAKKPVKQTGKYGHLFSSGSSASASKLAKLKMRAMEVYEDQYENEETQKEDEKPSIFSMFGGDNEEDKRDDIPQPVPQSNGFGQEMQQENSFRNTYPEPRTEDLSIAQPRSFTEPVPNNFNNAPAEPVQDTAFPAPLPPKEEDGVAKEDAFNRMLGFEPKKEAAPKKKNDDEWTPIF